MPDPSLTRLDAPRPRAVILMLHGGKESSRTEVDGRSASWRRSAAMQRAITPQAHEAGASTWLLRYRHRGWNGGSGATADARRAIAEVRRELGEFTVGLLRPSLGARTSVHVADEPTVQGVVGLAPWFPPGEPVAALHDRHLVAAHGSRDRITSARATRDYLQRARRTAASVTYLDMGPVGHYMLRTVPRWNQVALEQSLSVLDGTLRSRPQHP